MSTTKKANAIYRFNQSMRSSTEQDYLSDFERSATASPYTGDAKKTIPEYVRNNPHLLVSLLYLDFDVYEPTKVALQQFLPRMPKGAVIAFDELNLRDWPGETVAALQVLDMNRLPLRRFPFGSTISYALVGSE